MFNFWPGNKKAALNQLIHKANQDCKYTPDRLLQSRFGRALMFEYGEMKDEFARNRIYGVPCLAECWTNERFYVWTEKKGIDSKPIASKMAGPNQMPRERVKGELYLIPTDHIFHIDNYKLNGVQFKRKRTKVLLPWMAEVRKNGITYTTRAVANAWMYVGTKFWDDQFQWEIDFYKGRNSDKFTNTTITEDKNFPDISRFYNFTKADCKENIQPKCYIYNGPITGNAAK